GVLFFMTPSLGFLPNAIQATLRRGSRDWSRPIGQRTCVNTVVRPVCALHIHYNAMLLASLSFRAQPHKRGEILSAVDEAVSRMRRATGRERCRLLFDTEPPNAFTLISEWHSGDEA